MERMRMLHDGCVLAVLTVLRAQADQDDDYSLRYTEDGGSFPYDSRRPTETNVTEVSSSGPSMAWHMAWHGMAQSRRCMHAPHRTRQRIRGRCA